MASLTTLLQTKYDFVVGNECCKHTGLVSEATHTSGEEACADDGHGEGSIHVQTV